MARKRYKPEEIVSLLRQAEVLHGQGMSIAALLRGAGWQVNDKRVERLWRREGLKVPEKQPKRRGRWLNDGSRILLRAERADHA